MFYNGIMKKNTVFKFYLKDTNKVYRISAKGKSKKCVYESGDLMECFDFLFSILRKERNKLRKQNERDLQNFIDFGEM